MDAYGLAAGTSLRIFMSGGAEVNFFDFTEMKGSQLKQYVFKRDISMRSTYQHIVIWESSMVCSFQSGLRAVHGCNGKLIQSCRAPPGAICSPKQGKLNKARCIHCRFVTYTPLSDDRWAAIRARVAGARCTGPFPQPPSSRLVVTSLVRSHIFPTVSAHQSTKESFSRSCES